VGDVLECPVVFDVQPDGADLGPLIVDAIVQLAKLGILDVSTAKAGNTVGPKGDMVSPGFTTADFLKAITPVAPAPDGSTIAGDTFAGVTPGSTVTFRVEAQNDFQPPQLVEQVFDADIHVLGDAVTLLDVRKVYIIVPPKIQDSPK
jgi:hypothetical protein